MLVGSMVQHHVDDDTDAKFSCFFEKKIHIFHRSEARVDPIIVSDIVSIVFHW